MTQAAQSGLELAYRTQALFAGAVGLACVSLAVVCLVIALNSVRASIGPLSERAVARWSHRVKRLLRGYLLF